MSDDPRINGMLFDDIRKEGNKENMVDKNKSVQNEIINSHRVSGMAEVVLDVDRDGFVELLMTLLSSLP